MEQEEQKLTSIHQGYEVDNGGNQVNEDGYLID